LVISELRNAFAFLTILRVGYDEDVLPGRSFAFYPVVGLVIGLILFVITLSAQRLFSPDVTAFFILIGWVILTGGLHLDGFGDSCDGLFATVEPDRRLEIMKDSRVGSWAVVGLALLLLGKWVALQNVKPVMLILPPVVGRWAMVIAVYAFPYARATGVGAYFRTGFGRWQAIIASVVTTVIVIGASIAADLRAILILPLVVLIVWGAGRWAASRLGGGLTGDVYGALCELVELLTLLMLTIL
jgi:adenosylcobinamide-GDP ribazoletransferase